MTRSLAPQGERTQHSIILLNTLAKRLLIVILLSVEPSPICFPSLGFILPHVVLSLSSKAYENVCATSKRQMSTNVL